MTFEDLENEVKLHQYFVVEGNSTLEIPRGLFPEEWREPVRLGLRWAWLRQDTHWRWNTDEAIARGYSEPVTVYTLTEHGRKRFFNRKT